MLPACCLQFLLQKAFIERVMLLPSFLLQFISVPHKKGDVLH
jgi:hypothetical protein